MPETLAAADQETATAAPPRKRRIRVATLLRYAAIGVVVTLVAETLRIFVGSNFFTVVPERCYRSAQPTPSYLQDSHRTYGIRTIINLRDENPKEPWYQKEKKSAEDLGLNLVNAGLSSQEQPPQKEFRILVKALSECPEPLLIHCANGNDRTGLACALYLLLRTPATIAEARGQLSLRYGHIYWTKTACLDRMLDSYENWLKEHQFEHSPARVRDWADRAYEPESMVQDRLVRERRAREAKNGQR